MAEYIEREALLETMGELYDCYNPDIERDRNIGKGITIVKWVAESHPTADVAEVRHGRNVTQINPVDEFICSECGFMCEDVAEKFYDEDFDYFRYREYEFKYCPNCGTKIDKENE